MSREIIINDTKYTYELIKKRVKNINIRVKNGVIVVSAPNRVPIYEIEDVLRKNEKFIVKAFKKINEAKSEEIEYITGDKIKIFDEEKTLSVLPGRINKAYLKDDTINLLVANVDDKEAKKKAVGRLLDRCAKEKLLEIINEIYPHFESRVDFPKLSFRRTTSQWGSCSKEKNRLSFNLHLVRFPLECSRYVVIHEFTHFIHFDHSKEFYNEIEKLMPDYKKWQKMLRTYIE